MNLQEAKEKYRDQIPHEILESYKEPDVNFIVNDNDPTLEKIVIPIEKVQRYIYKHYGREWKGIPDWDKIDGFGLPAHEQVFKRQEPPKSLKELERKVVRILEDKESRDKTQKVTGQKLLKSLYSTITSDTKKYKEELRWIKKQWFHRLFGQWVFINGKPTWLPPWYFFYVNYWHMGDVDLPSYRDVDRRSFLFYTYCNHTTETFAKLDKTGRAIPEDDGTYIMKDIGRRTCYGVINPKHRRGGNTYQALCVEYDIISKMMGASVLGGIQSYTENNAKEHFVDKMVPAFKRMPWFFKPMWYGNTMAKNLTFKLPTGQTVGEELESRIDFATTVSASYYDGKKMFAYLCDESGKTSGTHVYKRWNTIKPCLAQGDVIHGFSMHPSTVEDMEEDNGQFYYDMCQDSSFYERNPLNGQTKTGLFRLFKSTLDGIEGFVGKYGESISGDPTPEQAEFIGKNFGAREYYEEERAQLIREDTPESKAKYRETVKKFPFIYDECFLGASGEIGFDVIKLDRRINDLKKDPNATIRGKFYWLFEGIDHPVSAKEYVEQGYMDKNMVGRVIWESDESGKWELSEIPLPERTNRKISKRVWDGLSEEYVNAYAPEFPDKYTSSGDPFRFSTKSESKLIKTGDKMSDGGGAVFKNRDYNIDPDSKPIHEWDTYRFVATYRYRPANEDEYAEEMLMASIYFGAMHYPEVNVRLLWKHFLKRGFGGYLKYEIDEITKKPKAYCGFYSTGNQSGSSKNQLFNAIRNYIDHRIHKERHMKFLVECREIKSMEEMTRYDLLTACGGCLMGAESIHGKILSKSRKNKKFRFQISDTCW